MNADQIVEGELDTISYVVRMEEVYIGSGGPQAELYHLGGGDGFQLEWTVESEPGVRSRLLGRQLKVFPTRAQAEAFALEHAGALYMNEQIAGLPLLPPSPDQAALHAEVQADLRRDLPGLF